MVYLQWLAVHICAWALIVAASAGVGRLVLRKIRFSSFLERSVFTVAIGLGVWALVLFVMGLTGLLYRNAILALTIIAVAGSAAHLVHSHRKSKLPDWRRLKSLMKPRALIVACIIGIVLGYWIVLFHRALYPPLNWDSTAYHLVLARGYLNQHHIVPDYGVTLPVLPALNHMLFTWAMAIEDDILAQIMEHTFMMLTALALFAWCKRQNRPMVGVAAAAFWLANPLVLYLGESAYVDAGFVCYAFLGIYALRIFWDEHETSWWYVAMMLLSMAAGVRLQGLFFIAVASAFGLRASLKNFLTWRAFLSAGILSAVIAIPWYGYVASQTGNPFWPAFGKLSPGIWGVAAHSIWETWTRVGVAKTPLNFVSLPVRFVLDPTPFLPDNGLPLFSFVIAFPLAWIIAFVNRSVRWWVFWALGYTVFWFSSSQQIRFWVPALPLVALALYESIQWIFERITKVVAIHTIVFSALALFALQAGARQSLTVIQIKRWPPPATPEARERFLTGAHVGYAAVTYIRKHVREGEGVYLINGSWLNYDLNTKVVDASAPVQESFRPIFRWPQDQWWEDWLESENVKWVLVNHNKAVAQQVVWLPNQNPVKEPFWPDFQIVYADSTSWVFRRKPVPPETGSYPAGSLMQPTLRQAETTSVRTYN